MESPGLLVGVRLRVGKQLEMPNLLHVVGQLADVGLAAPEILVGARLHVSLEHEPPRLLHGLAKLSAAAWNRQDCSMGSDCAWENNSSRPTYFAWLASL